MAVGNTPVMSAVDKLMASQDELVPSVCRYLDALPVCAGNKAFSAALAVVWPVPPFNIGNVPVTPVVKGRPVALVNTAAEGVPSAGVTSVGDVANTLAPEPVSSVRAVAS